MAENEQENIDAPQEEEDEQEGAGGEQGGSEPKITTGESALLMLVAGAIDGTQILLDIILIGFAVNWILDIFAVLIFGISYARKGVSVFTLIMTIFFAEMSGELIIPGMSALPFWTLGNARVIMKVNNIEIPGGGAGGLPTGSIPGIK